MEQAYLDLLREVRRDGVEKSDRTGTGTLSLFGKQMRFDLTQGFPALTTKKLHFKSVLYELLWFLRGDTNVAWLQQHGISIWDAWADEQGDLGRIYGAQWRSWRRPDGTTLDQIAQVVSALRRDPDSRRHLVVAYNPGEIEEMALPPCHGFFQFHVARGQLSCQLYQRSGDLFLGIPFNIASYSALTLMLAQVCGYQAGEFILTLGDAHIYLNHLDQVDLQLSRQPLPPPTLHLNPERREIDDFVYEDFDLRNYQCHPGIRAPVAV